MGGEQDASVGETEEKALSNVTSPSPAVPSLFSYNMKAGKALTSATFPLPGQTRGLIGKFLL